MRKVIAGLLYDTATAQEICRISYNVNRINSDQYLYKTPNGRFFTGPHNDDLEPHTCGIDPLDCLEAQSIAEEYGDTETVLKFFQIESA